MCRISVKIAENGKGYFVLKSGNKIIGKININITSNELTVIETVVADQCYLHQIGVLLVPEIVEYARMHELKIVTISEFVQQQFSRDPMLYADVWEKA